MAVGSGSLDFAAGSSFAERDVPDDARDGPGDEDASFLLTYANTPRITFG